MHKHLVIPDCQVKPDCPIDHLFWIGNFIAEKKPDVIVCLGDFADMPSLSSYDKGKLKGEGRRYIADITAANTAMYNLMNPLNKLNGKYTNQKLKKYKPQLHLTLGNHEARITRAVEDDPSLDGFMSLDHLDYKKYGWEVHDFLDPVVIDGVSYCHYFYNPLSGRPYGGQSIDTRLKNLGFSFVQGHQQLFMLGSRTLNNGRRIRGLVHGSCYIHDEEYRGPQANSEMRGIFMLHEVMDGDYMLMEISLDYLCSRYEGMPIWKFVKKKYPKIFERSIWMKRKEALFGNSIASDESGKKDDSTYDNVAGRHFNPSFRL